MGGQPARPGGQRVGLVEREQRAGLGGQAPQPGMEALVREDHAGVGDRSLGHHARDVAAAQLALHPVEVVVLDEAHVLGRVARDPQALGRDAVVLERAEQLVGVAVVLAVEHHARRRGR